MDPDTWNAYHIVSNRARSVCYATRQQLFRRRAELTVNALISTASSQLDAMKDLQVESAPPGSLTVALHVPAEPPGCLWGNRRASWS